MVRVGNLVKRAPANLRSFLEGTLYTRSMPAPGGANAAEVPAPGPLATYFDTHTEGPGLWKWRHYFPVYERHLERFVGREVHIMEVGIFSGGSLGMWKEYFGAEARIYGVDIEPACLKYADERVKVFIGDQADPEFWKGLLPQIPRVDVLIDDGGHEAHQQITTLKAILPALSPGGVYLCEDITGGTHAFHGFVDGLSRSLHSMKAGGRPSVFQQHVASVHRYPLVTVIEKPPLPVPPFESAQHGTTWEPFPRLDDVRRESAAT